MANHEIQFTTPVGRLVGGNLYEGKTTNDKGEPLFFKSGKNKGRPRTDFSIGVAFPKTPGVTHWASEAWLQAVWNLGHAAFPQGHAQRKDFSWKIIDGDSTEPNKAMKRPCDQEGYPGHWVIWFSSTSAPKATNANGSEYLREPGAIRPGYYVQVFCSVTENSGDTPGLYWNPHYVALAGHGPEITFGPSLAAAGFGKGVQLPPGASPVPVGAIPAAGATPPPPPPPGAPAQAVAAPPPPPPAPAAPAPAGLVQVPGAPHTIEACRAIGWTDEQLIAGGIATRAVAAPPPPPPPPAAPAPAAGAVPPPPGAVPVTPNPAFTQMAAPAPAAPPPPPPPPAAPAPAAVVRQPSAAMAAQGHTRDSLLAMPGWTEDMLVQHGHLV